MGKNMGQLNREGQFLAEINQLKHICQVQEQEINRLRQTLMSRDVTDRFLGHALAGAVAAGGKPEDVAAYAIACTNVLLDQLNSAADKAQEEEAKNNLAPIPEVTEASSIIQV
jgi:hypothetical protein